MPPSTQFTRAKPSLAKAAAAREPIGPAWQDATTRIERSAKTAGRLPDSTSSIEISRAPGILPVDAAIASAGRSSGEAADGCFEAARFEQTIGSHNFGPK